MNTKVFRSMSYGVYVTTSMDGERPVGCITNSIMQITSQPATVAVSVNHDNYTNGCIEKSGKFAFSILAEGSERSLIGRFGFKSSRDVDKFEGLSYKMAEGLPVLLDGCGYVICKVVGKMETSTHTVFLGEVIEAEVSDKTPAMTYAYYHEVIRGKSPKNAPTYIPEEDKKPIAKAEKPAPKVKYVCKICGYVYDGDPLPADFICPICKHPASDFERVEE
ncbi:MAG: flavin reductase [Candidatus Pelethousia sp.]|nr:flavin reductase [Candidatus Pelethousia sp.]